MSLDFTDDQSTLVQVMAWCHQATSHYLSQSWPRSLSPYGVTRPQWVNEDITHTVSSLFSWDLAHEQQQIVNHHGLLYMCSKFSKVPNDLIIFPQISMFNLVVLLINKKSILVKVITCQRSGEDLLPEPVMPQFFMHLCFFYNTKDVTLAYKHWYALFSPSRRTMATQKPYRS